MPKTMKQVATSELQPQYPLKPSPRMEIKKLQSYTRLCLLISVLVLALIVIGVALQASKSSQPTKTPTQAAHSRIGQAQSWYLAHDTHELLTVEQAQSWYLAHDTHEPLTVEQAQPWYLAHDTHEPLTVGLSVRN
jgi:hypothetical protein